MLCFTLCACIDTVGFFVFEPGPAARHIFSVGETSGHDRIESNQIKIKSSSLVPPRPPSPPSRARQVRYRTLHTVQGCEC